MVRIGPLEFPFTRIADPDRVLDQVAADADRQERLTGRRAPDEQLHLPYWAELWDSALGIAQFLLRSSEDAETRGHGDTGTALPVGQTDSSARFPASPRPRVPASLPVRVLDLGCGMGLSGTVAAALGMRVLCVDLEAPALVFARLNSLPWSARVRTRRLNWRTDVLNERFDLILGADILYERTQWEYLEPFWRQHLAPTGTVLLGEPGRQTGELFLEWIRDKQWEVSIDEEPVPTRLKPIRIFGLRTKLGSAGARLQSDSNENSAPVHPKANQP